MLSKNNGLPLRVRPRHHWLIPTRLLLAALIPAASIHASPQSPTLQITSPAAGTVVNPGQTLTVSVTSSAPSAFLGVELFGDNPLGLVGTFPSLPGQLSVTIPSSQIDPGSYFLTVSGNLASGQEPVSATVEVDVERADFPVSISAAISPLIFNSVGEQFRTNLLAGFADGSTLRATVSSYVTYASSNTAIATVDSSGLVTAVAPGTTTVVVTYASGSNSNQIFIPVTVPAPGIAGPPPTISSLTPALGSVGTSVTIAGTNFGSPQGTSAVTFNGTSATPTSWSATGLTVPVPAGATTGNVVVTVGGQASNGVNFTVTSSAAAVQQASNSDITGTGYTSFSATFASATTTGNAVVLGLTYGNANAHISATDNFGNTYALATQTYDPGHNQGSTILYALNIHGGSSHTVTINADSSVAYLALGIHEYSGLAAAAAPDVAVGQTGTGTSPSSGTATTTASKELIFGVGVEDAIGRGDSFTAGTGFTKRTDLGNAAAYADEDQTQSSAGPIAAAWSLSPSSDWIGGMAAFRPPGALQGTAHVQQAANSDVSGATYTSFTASFTYPTTSGNAVILGVTFGNTNPTITATDNEGNSYTVAQQTYDAGHNQGTAILYALNIHGGSSHTVTINFSTAVAYLGLGINEYTGLATSSALDGVAGHTGSGTTLSSGTVTTTANGDLIFSVGVADSSGSQVSIAAGTGFTKRVDLGSLASYADEDEVQTSAGTISATWTLSLSQNWIASVAAFKPQGTH